MCLLFGVYYSCGYFSLLTQPPYSKPIDTIDDFFREKLSLGERNSVENMRSKLYEFDLPEAATTVVHEHSDEERMKNIQSGKFAYYTTTLTNKYIIRLPLYNTTRMPLRLMRSCLNRYYTVLAFPLLSPYMNFFTNKLLQ